jgi:hypothetical protein
MALFLLIRIEVYHSYLPLYAAGKIIALAASASWCVFTAGGMLYAALFDLRALLLDLFYSVNREEILLVTGAMAFLLAGDALSAAGAFHIKARFGEKSAGTADAGAAESGGGV